MWELLNKCNYNMPIKYFLNIYNSKWSDKPCMSVCVCVRVCVLSHVRLFDTPDYTLPGSSVHGVFQARILEWVAIYSSRGSSPPRDWARVSCISCIGRWILYHCTNWVVADKPYCSLKSQKTVQFIYSKKILTIKRS